MNNYVRVLLVGDLIGNPGLALFEKWIPSLKEKHALDAIVVNGENAAKNGKGITPKIIDFLKEKGAAVITTGNHVYEHKDVYNVLNERNDIIRPANYPPGCPGKGVAFFTVLGQTVAVVNIMGRVFMRDMLDCPFRTIESLLIFIKTKTNLIFVDFHAETTAEKRAMATFLDGKVSCLVGTHTHIQTADEQIMPGGTGYVTDLGGCGALFSAIGMEADTIVQRFLLHNHVGGKFVVQTTGPMVLSGVIVDVDMTTGKAIKIQNMRIVDDQISQTLAQEK